MHCGVMHLDGLQLWRGVAEGRFRVILARQKLASSLFEYALGVQVLLR